MTMEIVKQPAKRKRIGVDFDGVIHSHTSGWTDTRSIPDPPVPGAIAWLNTMVARYEVIIITSRASDDAGMQAIAAWLKERGFTGTLLITCVQVPCDVYIDDRAWRFNGLFPTASQIDDFRPWYVAGPGPLS